MRFGSIAALALAALVLCPPGRAHAHSNVQVFVGGGFGVPYVAPYPAYYYPSYPAPYPYYYNYYYTEPVPPPGFVPGHWEWSADGYGRRIRVWMPGHLN